MMLFKKMYKMYNASLNAKINEIRREIPNISYNCCSYYCWNEIPSVSDLFKKGDYDAKI